MTSYSTKPPFPVNQTSSFLHISTSLDELQNNTVSSPERYPFQINTYSIFLIVIVVIGVIGNILLFIMMTDKKLSSLSYSLYLKVLAVSDSYLIIIRLIREIQTMFSLQHVILVNTFLCKAFYSSRVLVMLWSPWLVVGLTLDRYVCVRFPLTRDRLCTKKKAMIVCLIMFILSVLLITPFLVTMEIVGGQCVPVDIYLYHMFFRLFLSSTLPCIVILVLNILIVVQINRSYTFRKKMLARPTTDSSHHHLDSSILPLVLVSVLAFVTLVPVAVTQVVIISLQTFTNEIEALLLTKKVWSILVMVYIVNFGQNFYILIASSSSYRGIVKRMFLCYSYRRSQGKLTSTSGSHRSTSASGTARVLLPSVSHGDLGPALATVASQSTDLGIDG